MSDIISAGNGWSVSRTDYGSRPLWTTTPPTAPGWFWAWNMGDDEPEIVRVAYFPDGKGNPGEWLEPISTHQTTGERDKFGHPTYTHWLGPLPMPEPPK